MKDRNGKTLTSGQVCVVHNENSETMNGEIVVVSEIYRNHPLGWNVHCEDTDDTKCAYNAKELEIIGDIR